MLSPLDNVDVFPDDTMIFFESDQRPCSNLLKQFYTKSAERCQEIMANQDFHQRLSSNNPTSVQSNPTLAIRQQPFLRESLPLDLIQQDDRVDAQRGRILNHNLHGLHPAQLTKRAQHNRRIRQCPFIHTLLRCSLGATLLHPRERQRAWVRHKARLSPHQTAHIGRVQIKRLGLGAGVVGSDAGVGDAAHGDDGGGPLVARASFDDREGVDNHVEGRPGEAAVDADGEELGGGSAAGLVVELLGNSVNSQRLSTREEKRGCLRWRQRPCQRWLVRQSRC